MRGSTDGAVVPDDAAAAERMICNWRTPVDQVRRPDQNIAPLGSEDSLFQPQFLGFPNEPLRPFSVCLIAVDRRISSPAGDVTR